MRAELHGGQQRDAGDDAGQRDGQHEQHRECVLAAENWLRASANAASVPSTSAMTVAQAATPSDSVSACQMSARAKATSNQRSVSPGGGNW